MIIYTYPECGSDLTEKVVDTDMSKIERRCTKCGWKTVTEEVVMRVPFIFPVPIAEKRIPENGLDFGSLDTPLACKYCSNYPANGGSGICNCILGNQVTC